MIMKALHLGVLNNTNISAVFVPPSFPGGPLMQGNHLFFSWKYTPAEKIDNDIIYVV